ncbi:chemotaxis protein [Candidatus Methylospira mobilis]|uniref:Chemotaxis protein n=1 Tax=Candidatus Methylospira mobilis TaxID=1808979 RepID=A0A5Q0BPT3_9GAMM|nr:CZB domain-containing protein [Candidatus Methylospira mobilis]QFY44214.1 chemotaxis protein [Candidatus Methylospira mobilis]
MNLDEALHKHAEWKTKLRTAIFKKEAVDASTIAKDNCCDLGRWLYGEAYKSYGDLGTYKICVQKHANFHSEAGKIAFLINDKKYDEADLALAAHSPYAQASNEVATAIVRLRKEASL